MLWFGLAGDLDRLASLHDAVERAVVAAGLEGDDRPLRPHVTFARVARQATSSQRRAISDAVAATETPASVPFVAREVALVRSHLGRNARYEVLARYPRRSP